MRLLSYILLVAAAYGQTVSNVRFDGVGDSSMRVIFDVSSSYTALQLRYGTVSCAVSASTSPPTIVQTSGSPASVLFGAILDVSGLGPGTSYFFCPEVFNGSTWSSGVEATHSTVSRTQILPSLPQPVSLVYPAQTGTTHTLSGASDCSDSTHGLQFWINNAVPGDTIAVPAGWICTGHYTLPIAPEALAFTVTDTSTSTIAVSSTSTFTENGQVVLSTAGLDANFLPGNNIIPYAAADADRSGGWTKGQRYYTHLIGDGIHLQLLNSSSGSPVIPGFIPITSVDTSGHTITFNPMWQTPFGFSTVGQSHSGGGIPINTPVQFVSTGTVPSPLAVNTTYYSLDACTVGQVACTTRLASSMSGSPISISSAGTGTITIVDPGLGTLYIAPAPTQTTPWILVTSTGSCPPADLRISDANQAQMFNIRQNSPYPTITPSLSTGILSHNWRFNCMMFDSATSSDYLTMIDPRPFSIGPTTFLDSSFIIFDQAWLHGPGYPDRVGAGSSCSSSGGTFMCFDGYNIRFTNFRWDNLDYWHAWWVDQTTWKPGPGVAFYPEAFITAVISPVGAGSGATVTSVAVNGSGAVTAATVSGGTGYTSGATISFAGQSAFGTGATGTVTVVGGVPTAIVITAGGSGYVISGTQVKALPGTAHGGAFTSTLTGNIVVNFTGGSETGTAYAYFGMDGNFNVLAPTGATGNCSATPVTCAFSTTASPGWPVDGTFGRSAGLGIFSISLTSGAVTGVTRGPDPLSQLGTPQATEGIQIVAGRGPGPYILENGYIAGLGIPIHFDDSGGFFHLGGDYTVTNDFCDTPLKGLLRPDNALSDGLWYGHRQCIEWKSGQRILFTNDIFVNCFEQDNPVAPCIALTPRGNGNVTDVSIINNKFLNVDSPFNLNGAIELVNPLSRPGQRLRFSNNLVTTNGWTQNTNNGFVGRGWLTYGPFYFEDVTIDHVTCFDCRGPANAFWHQVGAPVGGVAITDNIAFYTGDSNMFVNENVANCSNALFDEGLINCMFTAGFGNASFTFSHNAIVPSWGSSGPGAPSGFVSQSFINSTAFPTLNASNYVVPTCSTQPACVAALGMVNPASGNYHLLPSSPLIAGAHNSSGIGIGANMDLLDQATGVIANTQALSVTSTTASVSGFCADCKYQVLRRLWHVHRSEQLDLDICRYYRKPPPVYRAHRAHDKDEVLRLARLCRWCDPVAHFILHVLAHVPPCIRGVTAPARGCDGSLVHSV